MQQTIVIGLGSNIDPESNLKRAAELLNERWPAIRFSPVYRATARDREDQADFLNAVAAFESDESPEQVHDALQSIENQLSKNPPFRSGPRTIDLDLLLYGNHILPSAREWQLNQKPETRNQSTNKPINPLIIPHPRMHERRFVLEPLCALIDPTSEHPLLHIAWKDLLAATDSQHCEMTAVILDAPQPTA